MNQHLFTRLHRDAFPAAAELAMVELGCFCLESQNYEAAANADRLLEMGRDASNIFPKGWNPTTVVQRLPLNR